MGDQSNKSSKTGAQSRKDGEEYEKAASYALKTFLEEKYPRLSIETLSNVEIDKKTLPLLTKSTKERMFLKRLFIP